MSENTREVAKAAGIEVDRVIGGHRFTGMDEAVERFKAAIAAEEAYENAKICREIAMRYVPSDAAGRCEEEIMRRVKMLREQAKL